MESLISINNQITHGLPVLNGAEVENFVVYPGSQIGNLPSTFLGTSKSTVDTCFFFAAGAVPAQSNYQTCMSEEVATSHATIFYTRAQRFLGDYALEFLNTLGARKTNAVVAANGFLATMRAVFGANTGSLGHCQIMCFNSEAGGRIVWTSRALDLQAKSDRQIKALLVPFLMGGEVDTPPEGVEGSDPDLQNQDHNYNGIVLRLYSLDANMDNVPGRHFDFAGVLYDFFVESRGFVSWITRTSNGALQREYFAKLDGLNIASRDMSSLFWFQTLLQEYINRHGKSWSDLWDLGMTGQPSSFITEHAWLTLKDSPEAKAIIAHIRANRPFTAVLKSKTRKLSRLAIETRPLPPVRGRAANTLSSGHPIRVNERLQENVLGMPLRLQKLAVSLSPVVWEKMKPFRDAKEFEEWLGEYGNYQDPENDLPVDRANITSWPLWPLVLSTNPHNTRQLGDWELQEKSAQVLRALTDRSDKVAVINKCLDALQHYRQWWNANASLKGKINYRPAHSILESFLRAFQSQ